ncbi:hypothetical protein MMC22_001392 [Lobaria immixta]|nr:hypothetical protein [Lobaria immixta]
MAYSSRGNLQPHGSSPSRGSFQSHGNSQPCGAVGSGVRIAAPSGRPQAYSGSTVFSPSESPPYLSKIVQSQEDENVKAKHEPGLASLSLGGQTLPLRPGYGTQGEYIVLRTDYFNLVPDPNIIALFLGTDTFDSIGFGVATDYSTIAVTAQELDLRGNGYLEVSVRLSPIGLANVAELLPFLSSPSSRTVSQSGSMAEAISAMNVAVTQTPNASSTVVSGSRNCKFFPLNHGSENLDVGLITIRGYYSGVRGCTTRMLVKFYPSVTLTELIRQSNKSHSRESLQEFLKGLKVMTNYTKDDNGVTRPRIHTIRDFPRHLEIDDPGTATNTRFPCQELSLTSNVTVRDFFSRSEMFSWLNYMQGGLQTLTEREIKLDDPSAAVVDVGF